jgi:hypothetical protein
MKALDEIDTAFCVKVPRGALVRLVLERGLDITYDKKLRTILVTPAQKLVFGMPQHELVGKFVEYSGYGWEGDGLLRFETKDGYRFSVPCSQLHDYQVLE